MHALFRSRTVFAGITIAAVAGAAGWIGGVMVTRSQVMAIADQLAAQVDDQRITLDEVDQRWRHDAPREFGEAMRVLYEGRRAALQRLVADELIADAAARAKVPVEAFVESAIGSPSPISDADVLAFYASNRERLPGHTLEELRPRIATLLKGRQRERARATVVNNLARSGPRVRIALPVPRWPVRVEADDPASGDPNAPVTIVAFSDFQCPFCARVRPTLERVRAAYGDKVRVVWKDFPLTSIHPDAFKAAEAGRCAAEQDRYFDYHASLFAHQAALTVDALARYASELGLDEPRFRDCLLSGRYAERVGQSMAHGTSLGVEATPALFINGRHLDGAQPFEEFAAIIDEELGGAGR